MILRGCCRCGIPFFDPRYYCKIPGISRIILSMNIPYPLVGSLISTWVTAPTSLPFWIMGLPDMSVVK